MRWSGSARPAPTPNSFSRIGHSLSGAGPLKSVSGECSRDKTQAVTDNKLYGWLGATSLSRAGAGAGTS